MIHHKKQHILLQEDLDLMNYLRKDMVAECLATMPIKDIMMHPTNHKPISVSLSFNSVEEKLY